MASFAAELEPVSTIPLNSVKAYAGATQRAAKLLPVFAGASADGCAGMRAMMHGVALTRVWLPCPEVCALAHAEHVTALGHIQLIRKMIGNELTVCAIKGRPTRRYRPTPLPVALCFLGGGGHAVPVQA